MNNQFSWKEQRREAAHRYRVECLNARGEVECSECGAGVNEARGNRNAQELEREGVRKSGKGPVCNPCQASWRYSHHQDSEMEMANARTMRCSCGGYLEKVGDDRWECGDCNQLFEADDWAHGGPDNPDKLKAVQNADDKSKCSRCGADTGKDGALGVEHGYDVYCVDCAVKKGYIDKKDVPDYENADNAKCQCGHTYDQHEEDSDGAKGAAGSMPCTKCGCHSYYPERGFKDHLKRAENSANRGDLVDGDKKILCEKHAAEKGGVLLSNTDNRKNADDEVKYYVDKWKQKLGGSGHTLQTIIDWSEGAGLEREETDRLIKEIRRIEGI